MFNRLSPHYVVEAVQQFGPNVFGFQLATGSGDGTLLDVTSPATTP